MSNISRPADSQEVPPRTIVILRFKCDGTRAGTRFGLSGKRTSPFKSAGESVQSRSADQRAAGSNAG
jgi:hypothetical protein